MSLASKRFFSFIIDMILVLFVSTAMSNIDAVNPYIEKYDKASSEYLEVYKDYMVNYGIENSNINEENIMPVVKATKKMQKFSALNMVWYVVFFIAYFVIFQYYNNGQTIGKKLCKIRIVKDGTSTCPGIIRLLFRSLFIGTNMYNGITLFVILRIVIPFIPNDRAFYISYTLITLASLIFEFLLFITLLINKGNKALNDIITKTKVIDAS